MRESRVDVQVSIFTAVVVILSCLCTFGITYKLTYDNMLLSLEAQVASIHRFLDNELRTKKFVAINGPEDMGTAAYQELQEILYSAKQITGVQYLYTAKRTEEGNFVYVVDGLSPEAEDFRRPGDPIEPEIIPELERALAGEVVLPNDVKKTDWGKIFIAYLPVHSGERVVGVLGVEFQAEAQYGTYRAVRIAAPLVIVVACLVSALFAVGFFRRISNPTYRDIYNTDYLTQLKNRNAFETDLNNINAKKAQPGMAVVTLDLNNLKKVNDTYGHEAGDQYLRMVAESILEAAPETAFSYRVGGDEFAILLRVTDFPALCGLCGDIKTALVRRKPPDWALEISLSIGFAVFDGTLESNLYDTYCRADKAMYVEKKQFHQDQDASAGQT